MDPVARTQREVREAIAALRSGREEMNLVEFPFATLSERAGQTLVLEYEVERFDKQQSRPVRRKLTVTGDPKHGLPTSTDEEVYLGLLQLTRIYNDFTSPFVQFTRGQLICLMGWKNKDWSYHRLGKAFDRLTGVRLFYQNAWRDNANKQWVDRGGFGILESFQLRDARAAREESELSEFRWNSVLFESFQAGYLKKLDYATVLKLGTKARRLYRFLDKHFHPPHHMRLVLDLRELACEHIGFSRSYDARQIRRYLQPAIEELEEIGFLDELPEGQRYKRIARGCWEVVLVRSGRRAPGARIGSPKSSALPRATQSAEIANRQFDIHRRRVDAFLKQQPSERRAEIEQEAFEKADPFLRANYEARKQTEGPLFDECRRLIVQSHVLALLDRSTK